MYQMINFRLRQLCKQRCINPLDLPSLGPDTTYPSKPVHLTGPPAIQIHGKFM